jgi:uncharacterized cupredoxin-like copper-binding protein
VKLLIVLLAIATCASASAAERVEDRTITIEVNHSRFSTEKIDVRRGEKIRFVVHNNDPIDHELIVGPMDVHLRHETGTEKVHPPVPGEVTVPLFTAAETTYTFDVPGTMLFGCHLPGHWAYGMQGKIRVI